MNRFLCALLFGTALTTAPVMRAQTRGVSGAEVMRLTQAYVNAAPKRYIGSPGHAAAEAFIKDQFKPEVAKGNFVDDKFTARTPIGPLTMHNLIVKFPGKKDGIIVLASHYETNYWLKDIHFIGANDGACTTALLIALGQYYREHPPQGYSVWLLFTDGEESINKEWTDTDSLYGTRHIAAKWSGDGTLGHIKAFVLADMIGWKQLNIDKESNSTPWLLELEAKAGRDTGHSKYLFKDSQAIQDDHLPFVQRGVPSLDVIDFQYGTAADPEAFHHTDQDTMDKLSVASLQVAADMFLDLVKLIDQR
ncbi:M28 family peptidase [Granulicella sp. L46]|uniref:M28 family peptidase n=1 Tax=Granulicella sp. L46 TaxID=1641865 RepID=UPI00131E0D6E|nr:M28 family peptidase [Granulicella sp. L46]